MFTFIGNILYNYLIKIRGEVLKKRITFVLSILIVVGSFFVTINYLNGGNSTSSNNSTPTPGNNVAMGTPTAAPTLAPTPTAVPTEVPTEVPTITPEPTYEDIFVDKDFTLALTLTYNPIDITLFPGLTFASSDENVVTVDEACMITGIDAGDAVITAMNAQGEVIDEIAIKVYPYKLYDNGLGYSIGYYSGKEENLIIPSHIAGKPITIITRGVFQNHTELKTVIMPDTIEEMRQYTFQGCTSLYYVQFSQNLKTIGNCSFYGCTSLVDVILPDSIETLGTLMFQNCYSLKTANLGLNTTFVGAYAFDGCTSLTEVTIGSKLGSNGFNDIFNSANMNWPISLQSVVVNPSNPYLKSNDGSVYNVWYSKLLFYPYGKTAESYYAPRDVQIIETYAIANNPFLKKIDLPAKCYKINDNGIFGCTNLTICSSSGVTELGSSVFAGCTELKDINFGAKITTIGERCFSSCTKLQSISLGKVLKSIGVNAFELMSPEFVINFEGTDAEWLEIPGNENVVDVNIDYKGGITIVPEPTPEITPAPEITPSPEITPVPEITPSPESTPVPDITPTPDVTPVPETTPIPEITPTPTPEPSPEV